jgi:hypothetical protein
MPPVIYSPAISFPPGKNCHALTQTYRLAPATRSINKFCAEYPHYSVVLDDGHKNPICAPPPAGGDAAALINNL